MSASVESVSRRLRSNASGLLCQNRNCAGVEILSFLSATKSLRQPPHSARMMAQMTACWADATHRSKPALADIDIDEGAAAALTDDDDDDDDDDEDDEEEAPGWIDPLVAPIVSASFSKSLTTSDS